MEERQRGRMSNVDDNNGGGRERPGSFQMAAIRRQNADREQLEVELARRRSADIIASARQSARESAEQSRQHIQGIRRRWDTSSQLSAAAAASHPQQTLRNPVFSNSSEPRVGHSRLPEFRASVGRSDQSEGFWRQTWGNRTDQFPPPSTSHLVDRRRPAENLLVNSSTYFRIQIDHGASSSSLRARTELTLPPACTSWANERRTGTREDHVYDRRQDTTAAAEEGHFRTRDFRYPDLGTGRFTRPPVIGFPRHRSLRETASFVDHSSIPSERYHFSNPGLRSSYVGLSDGSGFYLPSTLASSNETGSTKETYQPEMPTSDEAAGYCSRAQNFLTELSGLPTRGEHRMCDDAELPGLPMRDGNGVQRLLEENYRHELHVPASFPDQGLHPSEAQNVHDWNFKLSDDSEEEKTGENRETEEDRRSEILASLSDMEEFIQKIEEGVSFERHLELFGLGNDSSVHPEDLCTLWQVIAECEGVAKVMEDAGVFEVAGETLYAWSLDRLDKLATACYRFVVCLISDLVRISERSSWKLEEFRIYMDAALLVKKTCQKMMEATADEQVSLRRPVGPLLQILLVYIRTLRLVLELYAVLNNSKPPELGEWSSSLCEALKAFVTEATRDLLDFHELLSQRLPTTREQEVGADGSGNETENDIRGGEEEGQRWTWRGDDTNRSDYESGFLLAQHQRMTREDDESGEESGRGSDEVQTQPCLHQYLRLTTFSDSIIQEPYPHGHVIPGRPDYRFAHLLQETESGSDGEPSMTSSFPSFPVAPTAAANGPSTDVDRDRPPMEGSRYATDPFGLEANTSSELTAEELDIFQSMLSPSTFQLLRENVLPSNAREENIMLALSVQMASRVFTETSSGILNGMVYGGEPAQAETFDVLVNRSSSTLLDDLVHLYISAPTKLLHSRLNVVFEGEPGVDGGALSREFFCLIFRALIDRTVKDRALFEGDRGHLLPAVDHVLSDAKVFWVVGVLVAQAACNGCHGLPGLSPSVRQFLARGARVSALEEISQMATLDDVADLELRNLLKKVSERSVLSEEEQETLGTWLDRSGFSFVMSEAKIDEAIRRILRYYVFESRMSQLVSIAEGMEELGWRPVPTGVDVETVFPSGEKISLDDLFRCLLINETPAWRSRDLQRAFLFFRRLCAELHEGKIERLNLSDLLHFFTGAPYLKSGTNITFSHLDSDVIYPQARTCNLELIIPTVHKSYNAFKAAFSQALLLGSYGFGFA